jgi:signal transduction histidine kinase
MLDDLGLQPALEWHVRDLSRRSGVDIEFAAHGDLEVLPDRYRTCVYRAIQEALTNCVRHAEARTIHVNVAGYDDRLEVSVTDDGIGLDVARRRNGLGLRGIEERVRNLQGTMRLRGAIGHGTTLTIRLPLPPRLMEESRARAAG